MMKKQTLLEERKRMCNIWPSTYVALSVEGKPQRTCSHSFLEKQ
jgi:hypothetical protein